MSIDRNASDPSRAAPPLTRLEELDRARRRRQIPLMLLIGVATFVVAVLFIAGASGTGLSFHHSTADTVSTSSATVTPSAPPTPKTAAELLTGQIQTALAQNTWPALDPSPAALGPNAAAPEWIRDRCLDVTSLRLETRCTYGAPASTHLALLLGDSTAISWMPGLQAALEGSGWKIKVLTLGQCPAVDVPVTRQQDGAAFTPVCEAHHAFVTREVARLHPDMLILSSGVDTAGRLASGATGQAAYTQWQAATRATVTAFTLTVPRVVVLQAPPPGANLPLCVTAQNHPRDCMSTPSADSAGLGAAEKSAVESVTGAGTATYVPTTGWFCAYSRCPAFVGTTPVFVDGQNLTPAYSSQLAPLLAATVLPPQAPPSGPASAPAASS